MEKWSNGKQKGLGPVLHHSSTPILYALLSKHPCSGRNCFGSRIAKPF